MRLANALCRFVELAIDLRYSTGSSIVVKVRAGVLSCCRQAYGIVVLPLPVGAQTTAPKGRRIAASRSAWLGGHMPSWARPVGAFFALVDLLQRQHARA